MYIPKNVACKADLEQILVEGLDLQRVKAHLKSGRARIIAFFGESHELLLHQYISGVPTAEARVNAMEQVYYGYSVYDVDGMFRGTREWRFPSSSSGQPVYEKSLVVRMTFIPPLAAIAKEKGLDLSQARFMARHYFRFWTFDVKEYLLETKAWDYICRTVLPSEYNQEMGGSRLRTDLSHDERKAFICSLDKWHNDIRLFFNGYVLYRLCESILALRAQGRLPKVEDEIWVTTFRDLAVMKTLYKKPPDAWPQLLWIVAASLGLFGGAAVARWALTPERSTSSLR